MTSTERDDPRAGAWPLATEAEHRLFAWPRYDDPAELEQLFEDFGRPFVGRDDVCLCMRVDPDVDGRGSDVLPALLEAFGRTLGSDAKLEILLVDGDLEDADWSRLGEAVNAAVLLASSGSEPRNGRLGLLRKPLLRNGHEAAANIPERSAAGLEQAGIGASELKERIEALQPWFYPLRIRDQRVVPGKGTSRTASALTNAVVCRTQLLVDAVAECIDFDQRSLLDVGCNCGFWAAHYVTRGVSRVVGLEGRRRSVEQAELYFSVNKFLPEDSWGFHEADVADAASWGLARDHGPYDLTLCAGILHHLPDYREVLGWAARLTREALIIDTRVTRGEEKSVHEPDDTGFNSIEGRRDRVVPNLERLMEHLRGLGFVPQVLPVPFEEDAGVDGADNYAGGMRVAILATRH